MESIATLVISPPSGVRIGSAETPSKTYPKPETLKWAPHYGQLRVNGSMLWSPKPATSAVHPVKVLGFRV